MSILRFDKIDYVVCRILLSDCMQEVNYDVNLYFLYKVFCRFAAFDQQNNDAQVFGEIQQDFARNKLEMTNIKNLRDLFNAVYDSVLNEHNKHHYTYYIMHALSKQCFDPYDAEKHCVERLQIYQNGLNCCTSDDTMTKLARCCICAKMGLYLTDALFKNVQTTFQTPIQFFTEAQNNAKLFASSQSSMEDKELVELLQRSIQSAIQQEQSFKTFGFRREDNIAQIWAVQITSIDVPEEFISRVLHDLPMSGMFDDGASADILDVMDAQQEEVDELDSFEIDIDLLNLPETVDLNVPDDDEELKLRFL